MCNDYGNHVAYQSYFEKFAHLRIPLVFPPTEAAPNLEPRDEIWPTDTAPVVRAAEGGTALLQLPWGLAPGGPGSRAVINMRSEGRAFARGRCLVPPRTTTSSRDQEPEEPRQPGVQRGRPC